MFAVIRLRGSVNMHIRNKDTLRMLNLHRVNHCVLVPEDGTHKGMLKKVENWVTWGEVNKDTESLLKDTRGNGKIFRLSPPSKGFKSTKLHYPKGDLGYRGDAINGLLRRML